MPNTPLKTLLLGLTIAVGASLSACDAPMQNTTDDTSTETKDNAEPTPDNTVETTPSTDPDSEQKGDMDGATAAGQGSVVRYDVAAWSQESVEPLTLDDLDNIKATFGKVDSTDENSLDYASNPATKFRFMATDEPYLDVIDSERYLEVGWYYANPTDSDEEKALSQDHAKKAYKLARQLMGDEGAQLFVDMLNGQIVKNKAVGGQQVELAKCEFYSCMLILNKSGV